MHQVTKCPQNGGMVRSVHTAQRRLGDAATVGNAVSFLLILCAFVLMEPLTYGVHRWVMHGRGIVLHRSHHRVVPIGRFEKNDWYPIIFAAVVMIGLAIGFNIASLSALVPIGIGITLYGATYSLVHDGYIHRRIPGIGRRTHRVLEHLAESHRLHHRFHGEPYGMLCPIVPAALRAKALQTAQQISPTSGVQ
jgi:beta-carotene 3-hydroxylase